MIAIVNVSEEFKVVGEQTYSLRINSKELIQFKHNREDNLETCLRKAADAYAESNKGWCCE